MTYDKTRFDAEDKVLFNVAGCQARCSSVAPFNSVGPDVALAALGMHLVKGMTCTDCHRESIDHMTTRVMSGNGGIADASLETLPAGDVIWRRRTPRRRRRIWGKLGSPRPEHRGLPAIHLRSSRTACHSGPWPSLKPGFVQTSMAAWAEKPTRHGRRCRGSSSRFLGGGWENAASGGLAEFRRRMGKDNIAVIPPSVVKEAAGTICRGAGVDAGCGKAADR